MIQRISNSVAQTPKPALVLIGLATVLLLAVFDYLTGYVISFAFFYLIPVSFVAWFVGRDAAMAISFVSALAWQMSNTLAGETLSNPLILYWNTATRLGFFFVVTILLYKLRLALVNERKLSRTDALTGLFNARAFNDMASIELARARRFSHPLSVASHPLSVAYIDLDHFKAVNDGFGHYVGNTLLKTIAAAIRSSVRETDIVARLGGDEFAILFPETDGIEAQESLTRIRQHLQQAMDEHRWPVTFSIGVLSCPTPPATTEDMIREADRVMYSAKKQARMLSAMRLTQSSSDTPVHAHQRSSNRGDTRRYLANYER